MTNLTLHLPDQGDAENEDERADRALAMARGVVVLGAPRSLIAGGLGEFREYVREQLTAKPNGIVIDCGRLEYVDSSGLALLFALAKEAKRARIGYCVARLAADTRYLLSITHMDRVIGTAESLRSAIDAASVFDESSERGVAEQLARVDAAEKPRLRLEP